MRRSRSSWSASFLWAIYLLRMAYLLLLRLFTHLIKLWHSILLVSRTIPFRSLILVSIFLRNSHWILRVSDNLVNISLHHRWIVWTIVVIWNSRLNLKQCVQNDLVRLFAIACLLYVVNDIGHILSWMRHLMLLLLLWRLLGGWYLNRIYYILWYLLRLLLMLVWKLMLLILLRILLLELSLIIQGLSHYFSWWWKNLLSLLILGV